MRLIFAWLVFCAAESARCGTLVDFKTAFGHLYVELYDDDKPITVRNFLQYLDEGAYRDTFFHRAVHNFVLQGGGFRVVDRGATNASVDYVKTRASISNEFNTTPHRFNVEGTIAMAKGTNENSATSQFFFNLTDNRTALEDVRNSGGFTVFGHVVGGTHALSAYNSFEGILRTTNVIVNAGGVFNELPFTKVTIAAGGTVSISLDDFLYADISRVPRPAVAALGPSAGGVQWTPVPGLTNRVEVSTVLPPVWQILTDKVPGASETLVSVPDPAARDGRLRLYRVRILY